RRTYRASSPAGTCRIRSTVKRLRQPAAAVWRRWTASGSLRAMPCTIGASRCNRTQHDDGRASRIGPSTEGLSLYADGAEGRAAAGVGSRFRQRLPAAAAGRGGQGGSALRSTVRSRLNFLDLNVPFAYSGYRAVYYV